MKQTSVLRVTAEICFYFAVLSVVGAFQAWRLPMALFAAACLLIGLVTVRVSNPAARLALSILPGLCFVIGPYQLLLVFPALAWVYYVMVMARGHYAMPLEEYRRSYTFMLVISLFFIAANIANSTIYRNQVISVDSLIYVAVFLVLGVLAMRRMQMGAEMGMNWQVRNLLSVIGFPLLAVGVSLILFLVLRFSQQALTAVLAPIGRFFLWLFGLIFPEGQQATQQTIQQETVQSYTNALPMELDRIGTAADKSTVGSEFSTSMLIERAAGIGAWVLLALLLIVVLILIWRRAKQNKPAEEEELVYEETEAAQAGGKRRRGNKIPILAGNARQLRRIYKTYLEYRKSEGMRVQPSNTSAEILEQERERGGSEDAERLRELYIAARYGNPSAVTREQVAEAQGCLERIVG